MMLRKQPGWIVLVVLATFGFVSARSLAQRPSGNEEQGLFDAANRERAAQGLKALRWNEALATAARAHAAAMGQQNALSHQLPGEPDLAHRASRAGARFSTIAENIAEGPSGEDIHAQWMKSAPHRANLLDPHLDSIGIAVSARGGVLFAVEDFAVAVETLSLEEQERLLSARLQPSGLQILSYTADARATCRLDDGYAGKHEPSFVIHYLTPDVEQLPDLLESRIRAGKYHSAAVGACMPDAKDAGSQYRVTVLLFE